MPANSPPFRLLTPAEYALLTADEKTDYLGRLTLDVQKHLRQFREDNKRLLAWVLRKNNPPAKNM